MANRMCFFIPADAFVEGSGYRVSVVRENEPGHAPTGTLPYTGKPGETSPWFWGNTFEEAKRICEQQNERLGLSREDVFDIITSSMAQDRPRRGRRLA